MKRTYLIRLIIVTACLMLFAWTVFAAQEDTQEPPGPETTHMASFEITDPPEAFEIVTLVLYFPPGSTVPLHIHPGRGSNILLAGELVEVDPEGNEAVLGVGEGWVEEQGREHIVKNVSDEPACLLFTVLVPEGEELIEFVEAQGAQD